MKKQTLGKASIAYQDEGKGHPILMGHSFLWDANMWQPQVDHLKAHFRCIVPDLWSHGQSDPLPQLSYTLETLANDYWQFTQGLSLKRFALLGLSVGGMWATHIALTHPEAVSALVIMGSFVGSEPETSQKTYLEMMDELERDQQFTTAFADRVAPYFFAKDAAKKQPDLVKGFIQSLQKAPKAHISGKVSLGRAIFTRTSLLERLGELKIPTLIVVGEEDLPRPPEEAKEMAKRIKGAQLEIIPKAGHIATLEQPDRVNQILKQFLQQHVI